MDDILGSVNAGRGDLPANPTILPVPPAVALLFAPVWPLRPRPARPNV